MENLTTPRAGDVASTLATTQTLVANTSDFHKIISAPVPKVYPAEIFISLKS